MAEGGVIGATDLIKTEGEGGIYISLFYRNKTQPCQGIVAICLIFSNLLD